jgi:hypothetical protein
LNSLNLKIFKSCSTIFSLCTLNLCNFTNFEFIIHMLPLTAHVVLLTAHVLLLTAHCSLLIAYKIASLAPKGESWHCHPRWQKPRKGSPTGHPTVLNKTLERKKRPPATWRGSGSSSHVAISMLKNIDPPPCILKRKTIILIVPRCYAKCHNVIFSIKRRSYSCRQVVQYWQMSERDTLRPLDN